MDFFEVVRSRHSVRAYTREPLEPGQLEAILETMNRAPSAGNLQAYQVYAVTGRAPLGRLARAALEQSFIAEAPVALVFCADPARSAWKYGQRGATLYALQDATIACAYAQLAATALGLASAWVGAFDEDEVRRAIGIGAELRPIAVLPIGHPGERVEPTERRPIERVVRWVRE